MIWGPAPARLRRRDIGPGASRTQVEAPVAISTTSEAPDAQGTPGPAPGPGRRKGLPCRWRPRSSWEKSAASTSPRTNPSRTSASAAARDMRWRQTKHGLSGRCSGARSGRASAPPLSLADAWFGCKENIACLPGNHLTGIFQMKAWLLNYRYPRRPLHNLRVYGECKRPDAAANRGPVKTASLVVALNLKPIPAPRPLGGSAPGLQPPVRPPPPTPGWFLCTGRENERSRKSCKPTRMRWSIESTSRKSNRTWAS